MPKLAIPGVSRPDAVDRAQIDLTPLFGQRPIRLEIGFGGGEHLAHQAAANPDVGFIGCEPFVNGVAMLLSRIEASGIGNIRIHPGDARDLLDLLPDDTLERVFLLYPDPWPKTRHKDRRFMHPDNLRALTRLMPPGSELRLATDIPEYTAHALRAVSDSGGFVPVGGPETWRAPWPDWRTTRYEQKAFREGRSAQYLTFRRT